jgi:hypothetical protein
MPHVSIDINDLSELEIVELFSQMDDDAILAEIEIRGLEDEVRKMIFESDIKKVNRKKYLSLEDKIKIELFKEKIDKISIEDLRKI